MDSAPTRRDPVVNESVSRSRAVRCRPSVLVPLALLPVAIGVVGYFGNILLGEYLELRKELRKDEQSRIIGYEGINPTVSYANMPANWFRRESDAAFIWAGWLDGVGHRWFRVGRLDLEPGRLSFAIGRDVIRAIDRPIVEVGGGEKWERIPDSTPVFGIDDTRTPTAYPALLLQKVLVVNEQIDDRPLAVVHTPFVPIEQSVAVFDPRLGDRRLTLGSAGYLYQGKPLLYDRWTESLWVSEGTQLVAIGGQLRGSRLGRGLPVEMTTWGDWEGRYPKSRLIVGADRSVGLPVQ
jgi:hypothetical protein